jgi:predicted nucleic acid-binding protein
VIVVSDTTAITSLLKIQQADLLQSLFSTIIIPPAVAQELVRRHPVLPAFIQINELGNRTGISSLLSQLDLGEAEAILLAKEIHADALLIDERAGRAVAETMGIHCLGLAGALLMARQLGLIPSLSDLLTELETRANFYLAADVRHELLKQAGELKP